MNARIRNYRGPYEEITEVLMKETGILGATIATVTIFRDAVFMGIDR